MNLATVQQAKDMGLLESEFEKIKEILGRTPNFCELSIYGVMWSEHCSYKNSILWLKKLPKDGPHMLVKACLLYTSPSPRDLSTSRMPSSA